MTQMFSATSWGCFATSKEQQKITDCVEKNKYEYFFLSLKTNVFTFDCFCYFDECIKAVQFSVRERESESLSWIGNSTRVISHRELLSRTCSLDYRAAYEREGECYALLESKFISEILWPSRRLVPLLFLSLIIILKHPVISAACLFFPVSEMTPNRLNWVQGNVQ